MAEDKLKKKILEEKKTMPEKQQQKEAETVDMEQVEKIVTRMKQKYSDSGLDLEKVEGGLGELRGIIAEGKQKELEVQTVEDLRDIKQPIIQKIGRFYLALKNPLKPLVKMLSRLPPVKRLGFWLYSANMHYSPQQYLAITTSISVISFFAAMVLGWIVMLIMQFNLALLFVVSILLGLLAFIVALLVCLLYPRSQAVARGNAISNELPFALRHMATELKAGIGLYRTIQAVAIADYGVLSEEFARTINEIEEGTEAKEALAHLAARTQSKALKNAILHIIRAMKTGGNLSEIMNTIAREVSFEMREKIRDFSERMNFFGVIFIYVAIVVPVMISVLGSIKNSPLPVAINIPLDMPVLTVIYLAIMPLMLGYLIFYIWASQPRV